MKDRGDGRGLLSGFFMAQKKNEQVCDKYFMFGKSLIGWSEVKLPNQFVREL